MAIKKVYKAYLPSINYVTVKGRTCVFVEGRFETDVPEEIAELNAVCEAKSNPHIYIDPDEQEIDTTVQDRLKNAAKEAVLAEMEKINQEKNQNKSPEQSQNAQSTAQNLGSGKSMSAATMLGVANSATLGAGMAKQSTGAPVSIK